MFLGGMFRGIGFGGRHLALSLQQGERGCKGARRAICEEAVEERILRCGLWDQGPHVGLLCARVHGRRLVDLLVWAASRLQPGIRRRHIGRQAPAVSGVEERKLLPARSPTRPPKAQVFSGALARESPCLFWRLRAKFGVQRVHNDVDHRPSREHCVRDHYPGVHLRILHAHGTRLVLCRSTS